MEGTYENWKENSVFQKENGANSRGIGRTVRIEGNIIASGNVKYEEKEEEATIEDMEKEKIKKTLKETERNITLAAKKLGISRRTLYNKITKYGL